MPKTDELLLDDDTLLLKVDLSFLLNQDVSLKPVKVPSSYTVMEMLRKLLHAPQVQSMISQSGGAASSDPSDYSLRVPGKDVYLDDTASLKSLGLKHNDALEIRRKIRCRLVLRALPGDTEIEVEVDAARRVGDMIPALCALAGVPPDARGLRVIDRHEFLLNNEILSEQRVPSGSVVLLHRRPCFGARLDDLTTPDRVPVIVQRCIAYVEERGLDTEGIYRLSGSALTLQIFRDVFDKGEVPNFAGYNADAHVVAGLLKMFLREMAEPVVPFALYGKFLEVARSEKSPKACMARYRVLVGKLPPSHRTLARTLMRHMQRVAAHASVNRMPSANLAAVLGPNILRGEHTSPVTALADAGAVNTAVRVMIEEQDYLFEGVDKEYSAVSVARLKRVQSRSGADAGDAADFADDQGASRGSESAGQPLAPPPPSHPAPPPPPSGPEPEAAVALYDYTAAEDNELSLVAGEPVLVLQHYNDWSAVRLPRTGAEGLVPAAYLGPPGSHPADTPGDTAVAAQSLMTPPQPHSFVLPVVSHPSAAPPVPERTERHSAGAFIREAVADALTAPAAAAPPPRPAAMGAVSSLSWDVVDDEEPGESGFVTVSSAEATPEVALPAPTGPAAAAAPPPPPLPAAERSRVMQPEAAGLDGDDAPLVLARVVYEYSPREENELALNPGDLINVLQMVNDDWWLGSDGVHSGLFPAKYVAILTDDA